MKKYFITGLVILLPLAVTIAIVVFIVNFLTKPFIGIVSGFLKDFNLINKMPCVLNIFKNGLQSLLLRIVDLINKEQSIKLPFIYSGLKVRLSDVLIPP